MSPAFTQVVQTQSCGSSLLHNVFGCFPECNNDGRSFPLLHWLHVLSTRMQELCTCLWAKNAATPSHCRANTWLHAIISHANMVYHSLLITRSLCSYSAEVSGYHREEDEENSDLLGEVAVNSEVSSERLPSLLSSSVVVLWVETDTATAQLL